MRKRSVLLLMGWLCVFPALLCGFPNQIEDQPSAAASENQNLPAQQGPHRPNSVRALIENGLLFTGFTIGYWYKYWNYGGEWHYKMSWEDQRRRFFTAESPKLDANCLRFGGSEWATACPELPLSWLWRLRGSAATGISSKSTIATMKRGSAPSWAQTFKFPLCL